MATLGLSGLASGVDTSSIVDQLMAIERQSLTRIRTRQSQVQTRQTGLRDVQAKLSALASAATELRSSSLWANTQTVSTSDASRVGVERRAETPAGTYQLSVQQLAKSTQKSYAFTSPTLLTAPTGSSIDIDGVSVTVAVGATVDQVAASINGRSDLSVYAATQGGRLVLSSRLTGAPATSDFSASSATLSDEQATVGQDAAYVLDGVARTSASNVVDDALPGARVSLKGLTVPGAPVTITVTPPAIDQAAVKTKVKSFVEAYNAVVTTIRAKTQEKVDPQAALGSSAALRGQLRSDTALTGLLTRLRVAMTDAIGGNPATTDRLEDLGITTGKTTAGSATPDSLAGLLVVDEAKLATTIAADPEAVKRLMGAVAGVPGFAQRVEGLVVSQDSLLDGKVSSGESELRRLGTSLTRTTDRLEQREKRLRAQFAAMESALQASQTQQSWLSGQLAALNR